MFPLYNPTNDSGVIIIFINFSKEKAYFTPALGS